MVANIIVIFIITSLIAVVIIIIIISDYCSVISVASKHCSGVIIGCRIIAAGFGCGPAVAAGLPPSSCFMLL